ncbi:MAG: chromosome partitioning protein ParB [Caulobacteraceae bacterium]|nr:chromosome partitioning protein ParB [Caulobacteraceae bacterium]
MYKVINLFGEEETRTIDVNRKKPDLFTNYDEFVDKFEAKKTTDDCYTPNAVYAVVFDYVKSNCDISGKEIIRPFYPGGDFEAIEYPENCVVIDNPPFSIISKIARFYIANNIDFFLFAPHLTLFSADIDCTHIVAGGDIVYENGANIKTSFLSNMFGDKKIIGDPLLYQQLNALNTKVNLPKYEYPGNVLTVSQVSWIVEKGIRLEVSKTSVKHWRQLDSQKPHGKAMFGSGFLISEKAAAEKAAAEKAAAEKAAAEKAAAEKVNVITWQLSEKEKQVVSSLD